MKMPFGPPQAILAALRNLVGVLLLLLGGLQARAANDCGCDSTASWQDAYDKANVVFVGTCMDVLPNAIKGGLNVLFQIDSSWKRAIEPVTTVHTTSANQCGYPFKAGERYIVFANKRHQTTQTTNCEPNQLYDDNGMLTIRRLGPGFATGRGGLATSMNWMLVGLAGAGMAFLAFVVLRKKVAKASQAGPQS
jgi:hypothetical protein